MKVSFVCLRLIAMILFFSILNLTSRVPENLAGTSVFKENPKIKGKELPLTSLNLSYGAEFFHTLAQVFYKDGNIVALVEEGGKWKEKYYSDAEHTKPLEYAELNPMGCLVRILFWQDPGTSSLENFHISKKYMNTEALGETTAINWEKTLSGWASTIATACCYYVDSETLFPSKFKVVDAWKTWKNSFSDNSEKDSEFKTFFKRCVEWSKEAGFEETLPLKTLMAGVYEMVGNNQELIRAFYTKLTAELTKSEVQHGIKINDFIQRKEDTPYRIPQEGEVYPSVYDESWSTFLMLKRLRPGLPLAYRLTTISGKNIQYPDCMETLQRNIVCAFLARKDETFNTDPLVEEFKPVFTTFSKVVTQSNNQAYSDWAALMSNRKEFLYIRPDNKDLYVKPETYRYEFHASFINLLAGLNCIFGLGIEEFKSHEISLNPADGEANQAFMISILPLINAKLKEKLGITDGNISIIKPVLMLNNSEAEYKTLGEFFEKSNFKDVRSQNIIFEVNTPLYTLKCKISGGAHGEVSSVTNKIESTIILPPADEQNKFPYLKALLENAPKALSSSHLISVFLSQATTDLVVEDICSCLQKYFKNERIENMLYATIAEHYTIDKFIYFQVLQSCVQSNFLFKQALFSVQEGIKNPATPNAALFLSQELVKKEYGYQEILSVVQKAIDIERIEANPARLIDLLRELIKNGQGYDEAILIAIKLIRTIDGKNLSGQDLWEKMAGPLLLFGDLTKKGRGYTQLSKVIKSMKNSEIAEKLTELLRRASKALKSQVIYMNASIDEIKRYGLEYAEWENDVQANPDLRIALSLADRNDFKELPEFHKYPQIVELDLSNCVKLNNWKRLKAYFGGQWEHPIIKKFPKNLYKLNLAGWNCLTNKDIQELAKQCPDLLELNLSGCSQVTEKMAEIKKWWNGRCVISN